MTGYVDALWTTIGAAESTDTGATLVTGDMTCANFDCHNNQATPASYGWYAAGTSACTMCHAVGGTGISQPVDGLHDNTPLPTVSGVAHDESFPTGATCTTCHVYLPAFSNTSTHMGNGTTPADGGANTTADFYVFTAYTDSSAACSGAPVNANCHDGVGDAGTWARVWSTTAYNSDGTECNNCHGGQNKSDWTFGSGAHSTTDGNVEHNYSWDGDATSLVIGRHEDDTLEGNKCLICHVYGYSTYSTNGTGSIGWVANASNTSTYHGNGSIEMNSSSHAYLAGAASSRFVSTVTYNSTNYGCDGGICHGTGGSSSYKLEDSRWPVNLIIGKHYDCDWCHTAAGGGYADYSAAPTSVYTYWAGSNGAKQDGGHGDPQGRVPAVICLDCHDLNSPAGAHNDGTVSSAMTSANPTNNTVHLVSTFFGTEGQPYSVQVNADAGCYEPAGDNSRCHRMYVEIAGTMQNMRHEKDSDPAANAVQFGTHSTKSDGDTISWPIDSDITTRASTTDPDFAPCFACHDPHGTGTTDIDGVTNNRMLRGNWKSQSTAFCTTCHQ